MGLYAQEKAKQTQDEIEFEEFKKWKAQKNNENLEKDYEDFKLSKDRDYVSQPKKPMLNVYGLGGSGVSTAEFDKGKTSYIKFGVEYKINKYFGIGSGVQNQNMTLRPSDNSGGLIALLFLPPTTQSSGSNSTSSSSSFLNLLFLSALTAPSSYTYNLALLSLDFNLHLRGDKTVDPFVGLSLLGGSCVGSAAQCTATGGEFRLELILILGTFFLLCRLKDK